MLSLTRRVAAGLWFDFQAQKEARAAKRTVLVFDMVRWNGVKALCWCFLV